MTTPRMPAQRSILSRLDFLAAASEDAAASALYREAAAEIRRIQAIADRFATVCDEAATMLLGNLSVPHDQCKRVSDAIRDINLSQADKPNPCPDTY